MIKATFVAALIAAAAFTTQALARGGDAAAGHAMNKSHAIADCVRAPNVGAFASDPYTAPPCMPNTIR